MTFHRPDPRRALASIVVVAASLLAVACGGGGEQANNFHAARVIAFGDESSLLVDTGDHNGRKYSVNGTVSATDPTISCTANPLWVQAVANIYGLVFPQCNNAIPPVTDPVSRIRAAAGARAGDLGGQIDAQLAESGFSGSDIVTVMVGANDVLAQYAQYPTLSEAELTVNVQAAGTETGRQVNRLADLGAKVLLSTIVDVGVTPFGFNERTAHADTDRSALLTRLTAAYNASVRGTIVNDGRRIGLILLDEFVSAAAKFPGYGGFTVASTPVCDLTRSTLVPPSSLDCTANTFVSGGSGAYLWADDLHLSGTGQSSFGTLAVARAQNNPF